MSPIYRKELNNYLNLNFPIFNKYPTLYKKVKISNESLYLGEIRENKSFDS